MSRGFPDFDLPSLPRVPASGRNVLRTGLAWLTQQMQTNVSEAISYARQYAYVDTRATLGKKLLKLDDGNGGFQIQWTDMDFLIASAGFTFDDINLIVPQPGDQIFLTLAGDIVVQEFEVCQYGNDPCYRWADPFQSMYRIHAKYIGQEAYS